MKGKVSEKVRKSNKKLKGARNLLMLSNMEGGMAEVTFRDDAKNSPAFW